MHDIDRAMFESEQEEFETFDPQGQELEGETFAGETYESLEAGYESDSREAELATELLEVVSEEELEQFLGNLVSSAVSAARGFAGSATGKALGGVLKNAARQVLPQIGQVLGDAVVPGAGGKLGQQAGRWLGSQFEYEGLSPEDREFEAARALVRVAQDAARHAVRAAPGASPQQAATSAVVAAARRSMPGLVPVISAGTGRARGRVTSGRWVRRGNRIVLFGA